MSQTNEWRRWGGKHSRQYRKHAWNKIKTKSSGFGWKLNAIAIFHAMFGMLSILWMNVKSPKKQTKKKPSAILMTANLNISESRKVKIIWNGNNREKCFCYDVYMHVVFVVLKKIFRLTLLSVWWCALQGNRDELNQSARSLLKTQCDRCEIH